jgi:hypothetical protein
MLKARPFLKWAGGKSQLLDQNYYPSDLRAGRIRHDVEPFLGGGAVFFAIARGYPIESAWLSDINPDLVLTWQVVQQRPADLLDTLESYQRAYDRTPEEQCGHLFLTMRDAFNKGCLDINAAQHSADGIRRAAQVIFLNKTHASTVFFVSTRKEPSTYRLGNTKPPSSVTNQTCWPLPAFCRRRKYGRPTTRNAGPGSTKARLSILIRPIVHSAGRPVSPPTPAAVFLMLSKSAWPNFSAGWTGKKTPA